MSFDTLSLNETLTPIAMINGKALTALPKDLYIPPEAMDVLLETFEGPFDLLLYLIKKQNLDILNIPIAEVTKQYMEYVELMKSISLELAADYLVMAAILAEIKSRMLLPKPTLEDSQEEDPRALLVRRLQEYERFKTAALQLDDLPREGRNTYLLNIAKNDIILKKALPKITLDELLFSLNEVLKRAELNKSHAISREVLSVQDRMSNIVNILSYKRFVDFTELFQSQEGRLGVVVSFLAMLELLKNHVIEITQIKPFGTIHLKLAKE